MAKYTQNLLEWMKDGGTLPSVFSTITDFDDLFTGYYAASEIGFETPELFEIRLNIKADLVVPLYATRIAAYENILTALGTPNKQIQTISSATGSNSNSTTNSGNDITAVTGTDTTTNTGTDTMAHSGTDTVSHSGSATAGAQKRTHTDLPINSATAAPSSIDNADGYTNSDSATDTTQHGLTDTHTLNTTNTVGRTGQTTVTHGHIVNNQGTNSNSGTNTQTITGLDVNEQLAIIQQYERSILNLKQALLDEFKTLFMTIY